MIGQKSIQQQITGAINSGSLARFIILVGERGSGRKTLAQEIAKQINADFVVADKGVDAVREIIDNSYKLTNDVVYVLDSDGMSAGAKSALLKVTEEPPNRAYFIMLVVNAELTLDTLLSRACVYHMDNYTVQEIAEFAGTDDWRYSNYCTNKYEVDLLQNYGIDEFSDFVGAVLDNINEVSGANALKIGKKIAFSNEPDKYDMKIFLQAFRTECIDRVQQFDEYPQKMRYLDWVEITTDILGVLCIPNINKQALFDKWIFAIRKVRYAES